MEADANGSRTLLQWQQFAEQLETALATLAEPSDSVVAVMVDRMMSSWPWLNNRPPDRNHLENVARAAWRTGMAKVMGK